MMSRWHRILVASLVVAAFQAGCSRGSDLPSTAATVEGAKIASLDTEALVDAYLARQNAKGQGQDLPRDETAKLVLEYQIRLTFLEHLAQTMGFSTEPQAGFADATAAIRPEELRSIGERKEDFLRALRADALSKAMAAKLYPNVSVSDESIRQEFERLAPALDRHWKATVRMARFSAQEPAQQIRPRALKGEGFENAASALGAEGVVTVDINPVEAPLPESVIDAIGNVPTGQVSDAIATGGSWIAVFVEHRQDVPRLSLEDLRGDLTDLLAERERSSEFQRWFDKNFAQAKVKVDPHYGTWDPKLAAVK